MHKKLKAELVSLAHSILEMKNNSDVGDLHKKAHSIYEKLTVLKFVNTHINTTPNIEESNEEIVDKTEPIFVEEEKETNSIVSEIIDEVEKPEILSEEQVEEIFGIEDAMIKDDTTEIPSLQNTLEEELKDAISADVATELFERVTKKNPVIEKITENKQRSLNDTLYKNNLQVGLNDRIAFVKHLFDGNQEDFNRVLSQLNSFKTEEEAKNFINKMVKPDYDWTTKDEYEQRLTNLIERKFL
ncbi:hypothetical protein [Lutibacter sp.]